MEEPYTFCFKKIGRRKKSPEPEPFSYFSNPNPISFFHVKVHDEQFQRVKRPYEIFRDMLANTGYSINNGCLRHGNTIDSLIVFLKANISKGVASIIISSLHRKNFKVDNAIYERFFKGNQFLEFIDNSLDDVAQKLEDMFDICPCCPYRNRSVGWIDLTQTKQTVLCALCWKICNLHREMDNPYCSYHMMNFPVALLENTNPFSDDGP